ncbi:hypothetical protein R84B8_01035 [Treponema sp. R8-4-B8]
MPWRLILFIVIFAVFLFFIGFNLGDEFKCDINFGFTRLPQVPVFFTIFVSFALGIVCSAPLFLHLRRKRKEMPRKDNDQNDDYRPAASANPEVNEKIKNDAASARERFFLKRRVGKK